MVKVYQGFVFLSYSGSNGDAFLAIALITYIQDVRCATVAKLDEPSTRQKQET